MTSVTQKTATATIRFTATLQTIDSSTILRLPEQASRRLPSRGQVAVQATIDRRSSRQWWNPTASRVTGSRSIRTLQRAAGIGAGDRVSVCLEVTPDWPEPDVPPDLAAALTAAPQTIRDTWNDITPMARWEWVRWVNATANPATRQRRVEVSISKMDSGKRRPCCFDLASCTDPALAKSGKLRSTT